MSKAGKEAPGLRRRERKGVAAYYWVAAAVSRKAGGYPLKTIRLFYDTHEQRAARCRVLTGELLEWIASDGKRAIPAFDGSIASLIEWYERDETSPLRAVKASTRRSYAVDLKILKKSVGERQVGPLIRSDFLRWHEGFKKPKKKGGPTRLRRAHGLMTMVRMLLGFGKSMRFAGCKEALEVLEEMTFELPKRRKERLTFAQAEAIVRKAIEMDLRSIALGQAAQFEFAMRQIDVVGFWEKGAVEGGITFRDWHWKGGLTWSDLTAGTIVKETTKTGAEGQWNPALAPLVNLAISAFEPDERVGPAIIDERTGQPYKEKAYSRIWRQVADAAGIPASVWNMDSRSGALTESDDAGAAGEDMQRLATHANYQTTLRYIRGGLEATTRVAEKRLAYRERLKNKA